MLQIKQISKQYITGDLHQRALDAVSLCLRDNEFVAVLGPSGSGKTTLLNVIGGLDRYDSGDLVINGISTQKYQDRDWDSFRNHTIGFVFQSYNLIPHQSILSNVELALTISGVSRRERRSRAKKALEQVGLGDQLHKRPNQMSGGQMQRVAIARALVNDPDILLADEPTGALDTETSVQVMDLLKKVAEDRLVVMVTHNPELAQEYATRIVKLRDGKIVDDTDPYEADEAALASPKHKNMGKASMSFRTALSLSFNNLRTKKARTLLTSFAGSIGIIGIAMILALSTGVKNYIADIQKDTMNSYPVTLEAQTVDLSGFINTGSGNSPLDRAEHPLDGVYSNTQEWELASTFVSGITENNLTSFKKYLDDPDSPIHEYIGDNGIIYSYDTKFDVYAYDPDGELVNTDGSSLLSQTNSAAAMGGMEAIMNSGNCEELMPGQKGELLSPALLESYDVVYGSWPERYDEVVLTVDANHEISATTLYQLGFLPAAQYRELYGKIMAGEPVTMEDTSFTYEQICGKELYLLSECDRYVAGDNGTYTYCADGTAELGNLLSEALRLKIVGVVRPVEEASVSIGAVIGYTKALTDHLIALTDESAVVRAQKASPTVNVLSGLSFAPEDDAQKEEDARVYLASLGVTEKAQLAKQLLPTLYGDDPATLQQMMTLGETELAAVLDDYLKEPDSQTLLGIYDRYISAGTYEENLEAFGVVSLDAPKSINLYADSFEDKDRIAECITEYNRSAAEEDQISYTDYVALLMSSVTTIVDIISYVLIAFVSVSLFVSSIMIGIITYISVLERTKEIGILRAIGASKRNIAQVFNAETCIIGVCSGLIGIGITTLSLIPINWLVRLLMDAENVRAVLPAPAAVLLVLLSILLTWLGGLIPSMTAAKKDPVAALRTE